MQLFNVETMFYDKERDDQYANYLLRIEGKNGALIVPDEDPQQEYDCPDCGATGHGPVDGVACSGCGGLGSCFKMITDAPGWVSDEPDESQKEEGV